MRKIGQAWGFDLIVAVLIFLGALLFFYFYTINYPSESEEDFQTLRYEAEIVAESLLSEGSPGNWDKTNVIRLGILSDGKVNNTKLEMFYELSRDEYEKARNLFRIRGNYYVYFQEEVNIGGEIVEVIGLQDSGSGNLVKISRVVVYDNKIKTMNIYTWE